MLRRSLAGHSLAKRCHKAQDGSIVMAHASGEHDGPLDPPGKAGLGRELEAGTRAESRSDHRRRRPWQDPSRARERPTVRSSLRGRGARGDVLRFLTLASTSQSTRTHTSASGPPDRTPKAPLIHVHTNTGARAWRVKLTDRRVAEVHGRKVVDTDSGALMVLAEGGGRATSLLTG